MSEVAPEPVEEPQVVETNEVKQDVAEVNEPIESSVVTEDLLKSTTSEVVEDIPEKGDVTSTTENETSVDDTTLSEETTVDEPTVLVAAEPTVEDTVKGDHDTDTITDNEAAQTPIEEVSGKIDESDLTNVTQETLPAAVSTDEQVEGNFVQFCQHYKKPVSEVVVEQITEAIVEPVEKAAEITVQKGESIKLETINHLYCIETDEKRSSVADDLTAEVLKELSINESKEADPLIQGKKFFFTYILL